jgi:ABC-type multidrug transport system ATPase subunit
MENEMEHDKKMIHGCSYSSTDYKNLRKRAILAVDQVSFEVKPGEIFGLIGPDGAGKTSIFRILATVLLADTGIATVAGFDVVKDYHAIRTGWDICPENFRLSGPDYP